MKKSEKKNSAERSVVSSTIIGLLILFFTLLLLYRGERIKNKAWHIKKAEIIDPADPQGKSGLVKFSGKAEGPVLSDDISKNEFIYLIKYYYRFEKVKKEKSESITRRGKTELRTKTYYENEWVYKSSDVKKPDEIRIGRIRIRLNEADLVGEKDWNKTVYIARTGKDINSPGLGDEKYSLYGIPADKTLFVTGLLSGNDLGTGKVFIVSTLSEGKTCEKVYKRRWFRKFFSFILLLIGLAVLYKPVRFLFNRYQHIPLFVFLSNMGCGAYILFGIIFSFLFVKFSWITVDLIWVVLLSILIATFMPMLKKIKGH